MTMRGFTLIELLIVILILAALAGLTVIGMGNIVHQARVQRSAFAYVQTITLAKEMALANRLVYTLSVNTAKAPGDTSAGLCPLSMPASDRYFSELSSNGWQTTTWTSGLQLGHTATTPAAMWSDKPTDQWYALMGPWQDANGSWWQARGGLPRVWKTNGLRTGQDGTAPDGVDQIGGCFGPANSDPAVALSGTKSSWDDNRTPAWTSVRISAPSNWNTAWTWDPYGAQVGPRRFLERGTRWTALFDCPEWGARDYRNGPNQTIGFIETIPAHVMTGRHVGGGAGNENTRTSNVNIYPSGAIDRNTCFQASAYTFAGINWGWSGAGAGYIGICSTMRKTATYQPYDSNTGLDSGAPVTYQRPVAMLWVTMFSSGEVVIDRSPRLLP